MFMLLFCAILWHLTHSSLRSPHLGCHSVQVSGHEEVCDDGADVFVTESLHHCLFLRSKPRCQEEK